jgi:hypothetical protein
LTGVAVNVTEVPGHIVVADATTVTDGTGAGFTVMVIPVLVTTAGEAQTAFDVNSSVTTSLLLRAVEVKVALLVPAFIPLTFHWKVGAAPPFIGVAVNVTEVPGHIVVADAVTDTEGTTRSLTVMVI